MTAIALYKIADEIQHALATVDDELPDDMAERLDALQLAFDEKAANVVKFRQGLEATALALESEIQRLKVWRDSVIHKAEWLKSYLMRCMEEAGLDRIETPIAKLRIQKNSRPSISLEPGAAIPSNFLRTKEEFDSQAAYEAWKAGLPLPGTVVVTQGFHLRIT